MRLEGFRCDNCLVESIEKQGTWHQVQSTRVRHNGLSLGGLSAMFSDPLHYCSKACLIEAAQKWKSK